MTGGAVLLALLLQAGAPAPPPAEGVVYPLGTLREPDLLAPGRPFALTDLLYRATDEAGTRHAFSARLRVQSWGYLGFESEGERRALTLETARSDFGVEAEDGGVRAFGRWRAPFLLVQADGRRRTRGEGPGWIVGGLLAARLSSQLELVARFLGDTDPQPARAGLRDRFLRAGSLGLLYQRGAAFEAGLEAAHSRERTPGGLEFSRDEWQAAASGVWRGAEIGAEVALARSHGRFPRRQWRLAGDVALPLGRRVLLDGSASGGFEPGAKRVAHALRGGLALFARRLRLQRAHEAARRGAALARRATAAGYNERRPFDDDERRALRERLALSSRREEWAEEIAALYRAQVDERNVPVLGVEVSASGDAVEGVVSRRYSCVVGLPWPPAWPWSHNAAATPFLALEISFERDVYATGFAVRSRAVGLAAELNREMRLAVRWRKPGRTPLEIVRGVARAAALEIEYSYAFGR